MGCRRKADSLFATITHFEVVTWFNHVVLFNIFSNNIIRDIASTCHEKATPPYHDAPNTLYESTQIPPLICGKNDPSLVASEDSVKDEEDRIRTNGRDPYSHDP